MRGYLRIKTAFWIEAYCRLEAGDRRVKGCVVGVWSGPAAVGQTYVWCQRRVFPWGEDILSHTQVILQIFVVIQLSTQRFHKDDGRGTWRTLIELDCACWYQAWQYTYWFWWEEAARDQTNWFWVCFFLLSTEKPKWLDCCVDTWISSPRSTPLPRKQITEPC